MSNEKFSLAHLTAIECDTPELVRIAAKAGYDYVSPRVIYMGLPGEPNYSLASNPQRFEATKAALAETGMRVHDVELARVVDDLDPRARYGPELEKAAELGARAVLSSIWTPDRDYYLEKFAEICALAQELGMSVNLEFVPIAAVRTLADAVDVLRTVNAPNAGLMVDIHHIHRSRDKAEDLDGLPAEWFNFCHLCDAPGDIPSDVDEMTHILRAARSYVGEGGIPVADYVHHMPEMVYSIELPNDDRVAQYGAAEHAARCLATAKTYFAAHPREADTPPSAEPAPA
ncbi:MAG: sugar phosphate isomerase/epimerase family protein [Dermatophilaceae bacterium]